LFFRGIDRKRRGLGSMKKKKKRSDAGDSDAIDGDAVDSDAADISI
jgi:hypothetical protein